MQYRQSCSPVPALFPTGLVVYYITQTLLRIGQTTTSRGASTGMTSRSASGATSRPRGARVTKNKAGTGKSAPVGQPPASRLASPRAQQGKPPVNPAPAKALVARPPERCQAGTGAGGPRPRSAGTPSGTRHPKPKKK